jgi:hypothetical protein
MPLIWERSCHKPHFIPQLDHGNPNPRPGGGMVYATDLKSVLAETPLTVNEPLTAIQEKFLSTFLSTLNLLTC